MLRVKEICKEQGITSKILADKIGIKAPALSRIINGSNTTTETLEKIAGALGVEIVDLFEKKQEVKLLIEYQGERKTLTEKDLIELFKRKLQL